MKARLAASVALAAALLVGTSACSLVSVNGTLKHYEPSDGAGATIGDLKFRNVLGLSGSGASEDGTDVALVMTIINTGDDKHTVDFQYEDASGDKQVRSVTVSGNSSMSVGNKEELPLILRSADTTVGGLLPVYVQFGSTQGKQILVPVLDGSTAAYTDLLPGAAPTFTPSPTPTATVEDDTENNNTPG